MEKLNEDFLIYAILRGGASPEKAQFSLKIKIFPTIDDKTNSSKFEIIKTFKNENSVFYLLRLKLNLSFIDSCFSISLQIGEQLFEDKSSQKKYFEKGTKNKIQFLSNIDLSQNSKEIINRENVNFPQNKLESLFLYLNFLKNEPKEIINECIVKHNFSNLNVKELIENLKKLEDMNEIVITAISQLILNSCENFNYKTLILLQF